MRKTENTAAVPEINEVFRLTLNGNATDPIGMVQSDGYGSKIRQHDGPKVSGTQTRRFKLVRVGYQLNLDAVRTALASHGGIPEGQWREAFRAAYPTPDGKGPVGVADPSWVYPNGDRVFPCVSDDRKRWRSGFRWANFGRVAHWRWLVFAG